MRVSSFVDGMVSDLFCDFELRGQPSPYMRSCLADAYARLCCPMM
jgi:hypothetical protein